MSTVLIVDDHEQNLYLLRTILEARQYGIIRAANGAEALELAISNPPDIIISDILMPVMDGFALCRAWKKDDRLKDIPFVFYTATYTDPRDEELCLSLGAARFIVKPVEPEALLSLVEQVLEEHKTVSQADPRPGIEEETVYYRMYNEVLIRKLEDKMLDLKKANKDLRESEEEIRRLNTELEQRVMERTEQLEIANKELEAFAYSVSHDLRAPLRAIDGFSKILLDDFADRLDAPGQHHLKRVNEGARYMGRLIEDLLGLSRMMRVDMRQECVNLSAVAEQIVDGLKKAEPHRQVEFVIAPGLTTCADASLIRIALDNLLGNAWKFTAKHPSARIEIGSLESEGETVFFVRDDGAGFDMTHAGKLFSAFQRLHRAEEFEGTGIGLALIQRIITRHGGRIWADGEVEKGATFFFTVPARTREIQQPLQGTS